MNTCDNCKHWDGNRLFETCNRLIVSGRTLIERCGEIVDPWLSVQTRSDFPACGYWEGKPEGPFYWMPTDTGGLIFSKEPGTESLVTSVREEAEAITSWLNRTWLRLKKEDCQCK